MCNCVHECLICVSVFKGVIERERDLRTDEVVSVSVNVINVKTDRGSREKQVFLLYKKKKKALL